MPPNPSAGVVLTHGPLGGVGAHMNHGWPLVSQGRPQGRLEVPEAVTVKPRAPIATASAAQSTPCRAVAIGRPGYSRS